MSSCIAAQLYTLRDYLTTPEDIASTLRRVKKIGYDAVQLSGLGTIATAELAKILREEGLTPVITHIGYTRLANELPAVIEEHRLLGCKHAAIGAMPPQWWNHDGFIEFARFGSQVAQAMSAAGISFSYHNHSFEFEKFAGKTGMELLFEHASPLLKAEIDTYWVQHGGANPASWIKKLTGRIIVVHLKDMAVINNEQVMAEVGEGNLEWPAILAACTQAGVEWYAVEQDICYRDPFESLAISLRNLQQMGLK